MEKRRTVIVTGATGGIGRAIVRSLIEQDVSVLAIGRTASKLKALSTELASLDPPLRTLTADFATLRWPVQTEKVLASYPTIHWLIHCAGILDPSESFENLATLDKTFATNVLAPARLTKIVLPRLDPLGGVISISSTAADGGSGRYPHYAASKGALNVFTLSLAHAFSSSMRRAIVVAPGPTNTPMREALAQDSARHQKPEVIARVTRDIVLGVGSYKNGDVVTVRDNQITTASRAQ